MQLNELIREKRIEADITQYQLGKKLGYTNAQMVSNADNYRCGWPPKTFKKISRVLKIDINEMIALAANDYHNKLLKQLKVK